MKKLVRRARLWAATLRLSQRRARLQHDQAVESSAIVDEVKKRRRDSTHLLADEIFKLDAVLDGLENKIPEEPDGDR